MEVAEAHRGLWPDARLLVLQELEACISDAVGRDVQHLPTRCRPWTVRDVTAHLAVTFHRFNAMLSQGRKGDLSPPFAPEDLSGENLAAVDRFEGQPIPILREEAATFVARASDLQEVMPHQRGPIPVALQLCFGLNELALHHDDVAAAAGGAYRPGDDVVSVLVPVWDRVLGALPSGEDDWERILRAAGRGG